MLWLDYKDNLKLYKKQLSVFNTLCFQIQSSILCSYFVYTFKCDIIYNILVSFKQKVAFTNKAQKMHLVTQYAKLKKVLKNQNFEVWLQKWEKVYMECVELKLLKIEGNWLVKDFVYAVESVLLSWLEYWKNKFQRLDWKKKMFLSFIKLTKLYQNHCYMELAQKGKTP